MTDQQFIELLNKRDHILLLPITTDSLKDAVVPGKNAFQSLIINAEMNTDAKIMLTVLHSIAAQQN